MINFSYCKILICEIPLSPNNYYVTIFNGNLASIPSPFAFAFTVNFNVYTFPYFSMNFANLEAVKLEINCI